MLSGLRFNLSLFSKYRTELMGIAAIMIIIGHAEGNGVLMPWMMTKIIVQGGLGVDIFLFLSGIGLYYSLTSDIAAQWRGGVIWYVKRYKRILIPYLILAIPYWAYKTIVSGAGFGDFLFNLSTLSFWTDHSGAWFIAFLLPLYLITPALYWFLNKFRMRWIPALILYCLFAFLSQLEISMSTEVGMRVLGNVQYVLDRMPLFIIGLSIAPAIRSGKEINWLLTLLASFLVYLFLYTTFPTLYRGWIYMIPVLFFGAGILNKFEGRFNTMCKWMGVISLESYLTNIFLGDVFKQLSWRIGRFDLSYGNYLEYFCVISAGISIAFLSHHLSS